MKKESEKMLKLITNENAIVQEEEKVTVEDKVYQSDPIKTDLYAKLNAFRKSQKTFTIKDLIRDNLK